MTLNKEKDELIVKQSSLSVSLDNVSSKYETAVLMRDAALEEITKLTQLLTSNYDTYGQVISVPWRYNKSQEYTQKRQTSSPGTTKMITDTYGEQTITYEVNVPTITTVAEYPKYNDTMRNYFDQMDVYQKEYTNSLKQIEQLLPEKERIEAELAEIQAYLEDIANKKNELNKLFYHKYSRYIQEGSWVDENYMDDNLYYLDALSVSRVSAKPKVTYDIGVVDVSAAYEYEEDRIVLESELGDRTYIEDTEFFGYRKDDYTKPYWELVIVTEKTYNITDPSQNSVQVKNYTTQFDDLFQRIAAASQTLTLNEGTYGRVSTILNDNGTLNADIIRESVADADVILMNSVNEDVKIDKTGVTITSATNRANVVKMVSSGILVSSDGGNHYSTAITGDGINADLLLAGTLNTDKLLIGGRSNPNFLWNRLGISSFSTNEDKIDYSSFVRMDQYGIYGIKNYSKDGRSPESMSINDAFEPLKLKDITDNPNAIFGLTWEGFFLNAANGTGKVTIGTGQDFKMSEYSDDQSRWIDRVVIGRLNNGDYYGFQLKNSEGQVVMETGDSGELYLKRKLRISNFGDEDTIEPYGWVYQCDEKDAIPVERRISIQRRDVNGELVFTTDEDDNVIPDMVDLTQPETGDENTVYTYYYPEYTIVEREVTEEDGSTKLVKEVEYVPKSILNTYFYRYETELINNEWKNVIKYFTTQESIHFATRETTEDWKKDIVNRMDRVTLGIVDIYNRKNGFKKVSVGSSYNSSEYLTKVMSIKANDLTPLEQFSDDNIKNLIETNENFALFDNGNLYARNAWIEGTINATDGSFSGRIEATNGVLKNLQALGEIIVGKETVEGKENYGLLRDANNKWAIHGNGSAFFENITISGKIKTAIFEHEKVQTVAGTLLISSQIPIKSFKDTDNSNVIKIYLEAAAPTNKVKTNGDNEVAKIALLEDFLITDGTSRMIKYNIVSYGSEKIDNVLTYYIEISVDNNVSAVDLNSNKYVLFLGIQNTTITNSEVIGISINASGDSTFYPQDSIAIVNINNRADKPKSLFGLLTSDLFAGAVNNILIDDIVGKYGFYSDNAYVKGTMVSETSDYIAGITTTEKIEVIPNGKTEADCVVFFAGKNLVDEKNNLTNLNFYVTREGCLYASNGYFQGVIEASKIIGNGTDYALDIIGPTGLKEMVDEEGKTVITNMTKAIRFSNSVNNDIEFLSFTTAGSYFYHDNINGQIFSIIHGNDNYGIGMFNSDTDASDLNGYKLSFTQHFDTSQSWIQMNVSGLEVARIDTKGMHINNINDLGENCECINAVVKNETTNVEQTIGINFKLKGIS